MKPLVVFLATLLMLANTAFAAKPVVLGICPFHDDTGTEAGERAGTMLPVLFLEKAKAGGFLPVIVNPGPETTPGDIQWPMEVARMTGADAVLVGQVRAVSTDKLRKPTDNVLRGHVLLSSHAAHLVVSASLVDASTGQELAALSAEEVVKGPWLEEAAARFTIIGSAFHHESFWFADTHFGQAITRAAEKMIADIALPLSRLTTRGEYADVSIGKTCHVTIRVIYKAKERSSKMYLAAVNGKEESLGINDGLLNLDLPPGPLLVHVTVKDPPYRQPVQGTYYANSFVGCPKEESTLAFEIGAAGEGVLHWR